MCGYVSYRPWFVPSTAAALLTLRLARSARDRTPLGPVYVEYSSLEEAKAAERALNSGKLGSKIGGAQVVARFAAELHQQPFGGNDVPCRTLYLGRVPSKVLLYKRSLMQPLEAYGPVVDLRIRKQPATSPSRQRTYPPAAMEDGWPKGYCYIEYAKLSDAVTACEDLQTKNQLMFYGKPLHIAYASPRGERSRLVPERSYGGGGTPNNMDRMKLLEEHLHRPLHRGHVGDSPRQSTSAASDGMAPPEPSSKPPSWEKYGLKENN